jgi:hypothetical protein
MIKQKIDSTGNPRSAALSAMTAIALLFALSAATMLAHPVRPATLQAASACMEDFTSDTDPTMPGFASSVFNHSLSGNHQFINYASGDALALFAGATDVVTFPAQSVTSAAVSFAAFGEGYIIFEGIGDTKTIFFRPFPALQTLGASDTAPGDNGLALGQIVKITLIGYEVFFDSIEIGPCRSAPQVRQVDVLIKPKVNNPRRDGLIKAVILSTPGFDARTLDPATVRFGAATVPFRHFFGDEDEDGDTDLIFFFWFSDVGIRCGDTLVPLTGQTTAGQPIEGDGAITTVGCP